eukprot:scaffold6588_cov123-Isochrysis_galbana.AAC.1
MWHVCQCEDEDEDTQRQRAGAAHSTEHTRTLLSRPHPPCPCLPSPFSPTHYYTTPNANEYRAPHAGAGCWVLVPTLHTARVTSAAHPYPYPISRQGATGLPAQKKYPNLDRPN